MYNAGHPPTRVLFVIVAVLCTMVAGRVSANGAAQRTPDHPVMQAVYAGLAPTVDGRLDDPAWRSATTFDDFYATQLDRVPSERTVVWIAVDSANLYLAARCYDSRPDQLSMEQTRRGSSLWTDDFIEFRLDVEHLHRHDGPYEFRVNPRGTQDEWIPDGAAGKIEWRGDWVAGARIDSLGWTVEVAIPLVVFNRPAGPHTIGLSVFRRMMRTKEDIEWPNMGREWDRTRTGDWTGIVWPERAFHPTFMPYVSARVDRGDYDAHAGIDVKHTSSSGISFVGTAYPDFRNVESDVLDLDFSYTERYRSDRRPFFEDGHEYLPESWMFYSNRVGEMYGGAKAFGQLGDHRRGLLEAYDQNRTNHVAGKWFWQPDKRLEIATNATWRHGPDDVAPRYGVGRASDHVMVVSDVTKSRRVGAHDVNHRLQAGFTATPSDTGNGHDVEYHYERFSRRTEIVINLRQLSPGFLPAHGLLDPQDVDQRDVSVRFEYYRQHDRRWFREWGIWTMVQRAHRFNGDLYRQSADLSGWIDIRAGTGIWANYEDEDRPPYHDRTVSTQFWWNDNELYTGGRVSATVGKVAGTDYFLVGASQGLHPFEYFSMEVSGQYRRRDFPVGHASLPAGYLDERYQALITAQYDITPEHAVSGRIIYNDRGDDIPWDDRLNGYATYRQTVRRGMDLFFIIGDPSADVWTRSLALKAVVVL